MLGVEAPLWTESVTSLADIEYMLLPRLPAIAELGWSPRATHDWAGFRRPAGRPGPALDDAPGSPSTARPEIPWPTDARPIPAQRHPTSRDDDDPDQPPPGHARAPPGRRGRAANRTDRQ